MQGSILKIVTLMALVSGEKFEIKKPLTTEANDVRNIASATVSYCPEQLNCTSELIGVRLPYIMDCSKYIYCNTDGIGIISTCPALLHFSPSEEVCVDSSVSGCPKCGSTMESTTIGSTIPICPEQPVCTPDDIATNIPYIADCTKYIHCTSSGEVIFDCPTATEFSPTLKICIDPVLAGCPKCSGGTTTSSDFTTTQVMTTPHCLEQKECVSPDDDYSTIPYAANCTQYVYCRPGGVGSIMNCPNGLHYSPTVKTCMEPELAGCPQCIQTTALPPTTPYCPIQEHCTFQLVTYTLPYVLDCTKYIYCHLDGSETLMKCPIRLHYSPTVHTCMDAEISGCPLCSDIYTSTVQESTTQDMTTTVTGSTGTGVTHISTLPYCPSQPYCTTALTGTTLPYISDCTRYIYCLPNATEDLRNCPVLQEYSPYESKCMAPELAQCPKC